VKQTLTKLPTVWQRRLHDIAGRALKGKRKRQHKVLAALPERDSVARSTGSSLDEIAQSWPKVAACVFIVLIMICIGRIFSLQVTRGASYLQAANGNRIHDEISYAPRGTIYDRSGKKVLARNTLRSQLTVVPYLLARDQSRREVAYRRVAEVVGQSPQALQKTAEAQGLSYTRPLIVSERLTHTQLLRIEQKLPVVPGFTVDTVPVREYEASAGLAHILGYVSRVNQEDLAGNDALLPTDYIGRTGIEAVYDSRLRGTNGRRRVEVDALGRPLRLLASSEARTGSDIRLTIDYKLQVRLQRELRKQLTITGAKRAAGLAVDPESGEILAMVSIPSYDNNLFAQGISRASYQKLLINPHKPLLNRTIAGTYPSGSTIKPLVAAAALQEGIVNKETVIVDRGYIDVANQFNPNQAHRFRGWRAGGLGAMDVRRALAYSSNIYFYTVGGGHGGVAGLGAQRLTDYYRSFGLGQPTGIDLPGELSGFVPTPELKQQRTGEPWYLGDTYNISIGQGDLRLTPLQILMAHAALANRGSLVAPHLLLDHPTETSLRPPAQPLPIAATNLETVRAGMHDMPYRGVFSAERFAKIPVQIAGKTGTAQASNPGGGGRPHGWFIAFAPYDKPKISLLAMIENVEGSTIALTPVINTLADYFD
jgi:penicillin-binding protein 2